MLVNLKNGSGWIFRPIAPELNNQSLKQKLILDPGVTATIKAGSQGYVLICDDSGKKWNFPESEDPSMCKPHGTLCKINNMGEWHIGEWPQPKIRGLWKSDQPCTRNIIDQNGTMMICTEDGSYVLSVLRGKVESMKHLPSKDSQVGDVYKVSTTDRLYFWSGELWLVVTR